MARIIISEECNISCHYCVANELFVEKKKKNPQASRYMDLEEFKEIVDFVIKTRNSIQISGGEPSLHPQIEKILDYVIRNEKVEEVSFLTNGIAIEKVINQLCHPKMKLGVSLNSPNSIGEEKYKKIIDNLDELYFKRYNDRFGLSINMYKGFDYDYILKALKRYKQKAVGTSLVLPNSEKERKSSFLQYCREMKEEILSFFEKLYKIKVRPEFFLPAIPHCVYTEKEKKRLNKIRSKDEVEYKRCQPLPEFLIGKRVVRCLELLGHEKVEMNDFEDTEKIVSYYKNRYDIFTYSVPIDKECKDCRDMDNCKCWGGCLAYRIDKINKARRVLENIYLK